MAKVLPDGAIVRNIMADGSECDDLSTYIKSADQLPELTKRLIVYFAGIYAGTESLARAEGKEPNRNDDSRDGRVQ